MYKPPTVPIGQTGRASIRVPILLKLAQDSSVDTYLPSAHSKLMYFQGTAMTARGLIHLEAGEFAEGDLPWFELDDAKEALGAFIAVYKEAKSGDLIVLGDFHGFQKIFYSGSGRGQAVVSDSLMALAEYFRDIGRSLNVDLPTLVAQYGSFNALLNHHAFSTQSMVEDIHLLRADQVLRITRSGAITEKRPRFKDPKNRDYSQLIRDALNRGTDFISAALDWDVPDRLLFLSGGRDSRSVFAMAIAGGIEKEIPVFAKPPPTDTSQFAQKLSLDRYLSGQLVEMFGLDLWQNEFTVRLSNAENERKWWLSHWAGVLHDYGAPKSGSLVPSVRLIGAMGANYRTKVPDFVGPMRDVDFRMTPESFEADFSAFFERMLPEHPGIDKEAWEGAREMFRDSLTYDGVPGPMWERLDAFSEIFRMSAHFGGASVEQSINTWNLNILAIPELTYAASLISREERSSGKVWKDLHRLVDDRLDEIPYEYELLNPKEGYRPIERRKSSVDWDALDERHRSNFNRNLGKVAHYQAQGAPRIDHAACDKLIRKLGDIIAPAVGNARVDHLLKRVQERSTLMKRLRGKLELLDEIVDPQIKWNHIRVNIGLQGLKS